MVNIVDHIVILMVVVLMVPVFETKLIVLSLAYAYSLVLVLVLLLVGILFAVLVGIVRFHFVYIDFPVKHMVYIHFELSVVEVYRLVCIVNAEYIL